MPACEICAECSDNVTKCKECDIKFCDFCGSSAENICDYCLDNDNIDELDWDYEDEDWEKNKFENTGNG